MYTKQHKVLHYLCKNIFIIKAVFSAFFPNKLIINKQKILNMKNLFLSLAAFLLLTFSVDAQNAKGDWYVGTGDISGTAWTDWAVNPSIGYAVTDNLVIGGSVSHVAGEDMDMDFNVRYFFSGYFAEVSLDGFSTDGAVFGLGKMFTFHKGVYVSPVFNYAYDAETFNLGLGFGLKF